MKDYSKNRKARKKFILSYKIENGEIVVKLANGKYDRMPYTPENEQEVISKMEKQAKDAYIEKIPAIDKILTITQPLILPLAIINFINNTTWFYGIVLAIVLHGAINYPIKLINNLLKRRELKKLNCFLEYKKTLNDNITKPEMLENVSKKGIKQIELEQEQNKNVFNINNIDNYSLKDLRTLKENILRLGLDVEESEAQSEPKSQVPTLKRSITEQKR